MKQKWDNENMAALNHRPRYRADKDLFLQVRSITIFHKIKFVTNQNQLDEYEQPGSFNHDHRCIISSNIVKPTILHQ